MKTLVIKIETVEELRAWSDELAGMIDQGQPIPETCVISFQDPDEFLAVFTPVRRDLLCAIAKQSATPAQIALHFERELADVEADIELLLEAGAVTNDGGVISAIADDVIFESLPQSAELC